MYSPHRAGDDDTSFKWTPRFYKKVNRFNGFVMKEYCNGVASTMYFD